MINYLLRRVVYGILILLGVNLITFVLFFAVNTPDDMARLNLGGRRVTADAIEAWKASGARSRQTALHQYSGRGCAKNNGHGFL